MDAAMVFRVLSLGVVLAHFTFIVFVVAGGVLVRFWPKIAWMHIPSVIWGIVIQFTGGICPLTPLENFFRQRSGQETYTGDFVIHAIEALIYPHDLTRELQILFGVAVILVNMVAYGVLFLIGIKNRR